MILLLGFIFKNCKKLGFWNEKSIESPQCVHIAKVRKKKKNQLWELNNVFTLGPNGYTRITEIEIGINLVEGWYYLKYLPDQH